MSERTYPVISDSPDRLASRIRIVSTGCWLWTGYIDPDGYGRVGARPSPRLAHREVYAAIMGGTPEVLHHDPSCPKHCVNPEHLQATTHADHPDSAPAFQSAKTHCAQGHAFDKANTYYPARGGRICRTCRRENMRRYAIERG